jgi:hypothetical protein
MGKLFRRRLLFVVRISAGKYAGEPVRCIQKEEYGKYYLKLLGNVAKSRADQQKYPEEIVKQDHQDGEIFGKLLHLIRQLPASKEFRFVLFSVPRLPG